MKKLIDRKNIREIAGACKNRKVNIGAFVESRISLPEDDPKYLDPTDFDLKEIAFGLGGNASRADHRNGEVMFSEEVSHTQFQTLVGVLLSKIIMQAYDKAATIGDKLVTKFNSVLESDKVPGGYIEGELEDIPAGGEYPRTADIQEKYVTISQGKRGLMLDVTEEAVRFDRSGIVMREAVKLGERMARDREVRILKGVQDVSGYEPYYPTGTVEGMYQNAQGAGDPHEYDNLIVEALADYTDLNALYLLMRLMKDDLGEPISVVPKILLVPVALDVVAFRIIKNDVLSGAANNERNPFANRFEVISSPDLDAQSSTAWYLGDFKKQFLEKVVIPMQVMTRPMSAKHQDGWNRDILAQYKVRYDATLGAVDYKFVGKSTGAG